MLQPKDIDWLNGYKNKTRIYAVYKRPISDLGTHTDKVRGWKKIFHANRNQKTAGVAILISEKIDFKIKTITRDKEGHYIMIKGSIQEDITIVNIYAPNIGAPPYIRQMLTAIKGDWARATVVPTGLGIAVWVGWVHAGSLPSLDSAQRAPPPPKATDGASLELFAKIPR